MSTPYPKRSGVVLSPLQGIAQYLDELQFTDQGRVVVNPVLFATIFFERGAYPDVRQGVLACLDAFEERFGEHLHGGRVGGGKYTAKTAKGMQAMRKLLSDSKPYEGVEFVRSDVTDQYTAPDFMVEAYTPAAFVGDDLGDGGFVSYLKFVLPWSMATDDKDLVQYHDFLRFVCQSLPVRGGYGGLTPVLPFDFDRYQPQEYALARRFTGLEMDCNAVFEAHTYRIQSIEGEEPKIICYNELKPGAKVTAVGHIKGVNWYTLLGDVFVDRLGGEAALCQQLARPDIGVERQGQCLLIRAGDLPRLGAPEEGLIEPYAFVNRAVRSLRIPEHGGMHTYMEAVERADSDNTQAWITRFDLPEDGPVRPWQPGDVVRQAPPRETLSAQPGQAVPRAGVWQTPAILEKRSLTLAAGEKLPFTAQDKGGNAVVWFWKAEK
ncbi:type VI immunity family protein [Rhodoferax aquaticus]|uniref:DUF3396 domain-containing protein n=1 Tax=Rhodoferax aquaticus TaxID=2527691 RepID=A0A515EMQ2_9BURK|nr:type VI immunity family protein [Rhodoferax aquaticus]QDL53947.1 DUF3396 domain-containing protein [Rhodoferax aquaticus]